MGSPSRRVERLASPHGDIVRPVGIGFILLAMTPLVILPLASIFIYGFGKGLDHFWEALVSPAAVFSLKLSVTTSSVATLCNVVFGLIAAWVMSKYEFKGSTALMIIISLPTAIPTAVAGTALLLVGQCACRLGDHAHPTACSVAIAELALDPSDLVTALRELFCDVRV